MSLGMIAFFAVVMTVAWHRYQRHTTKAAERSQANVVQLLMDSEVIAAQSRAVQGNPPTTFERRLASTYPFTRHPCR